MSEPRISVIIPIYNVEDYLAECLDSVLAQDFPDAEFVCVDDGSTDTSRQILEEYAAKDDRIIAVYKENGGLSSARNAGLSRARGKYIMFLDSDDRMKAGSLSHLWDHAGADIIIFCADTFPEGADKDEWYKKTLQFSAASYDSFTPSVLFGHRGSMPFVWRQAFRREFLEESRVAFDESLKYGEDVVFQMEIFPLAERFEFVEDVLIDYRLKREGSLMHGTVNDAALMVERHYEMIRHIAAYWKEKGWLELYGPNFLSWALKFTLLKVKALPADSRHEKAWEMFDIIDQFGLSDFRKSMDIKGKLMWDAFSAMRRV